MIDIVCEEVEMPSIYDRKYQKIKDEKSNKWYVIDTDTNEKVYTGNFDNVIMSCYHLNKKYYRGNK
jgi:hypothetical protein